jgi:putrescine transport system permease protein
MSRNAPDTAALLRRIAVLAPPYLWLAVFFVLPLLVVFGISLADPVSGIPPYGRVVEWAGGLALHFTGDLEKYTALLGDPYYLDGFLGAFRIALVATVICLLIGYPMAWAIARARPSLRIVLLLAVMVPFWTSFLIRIYAWMAILNSNGLANQVLLSLGLVDRPLVLLYTDFAVYLGIVYAYLPFMVLPLYAVLDRIDRNLLEAAADLGATPARTFLSVTLPLSLPGVAAGCLLVFVPALGEFVVPELLGGSDFLMIGRLLWTETFQNRDWPMAAAIAIAILLLVVVPVMILRRFVEPSDEGRA